MYSLNDLPIGCVKIEIPENGHCNEVISTCDMPLVKVEISESSSNTVSHQTISMSRESIQELPLLRDAQTHEDVLNIQISNVQGAMSDQIVEKNVVPVYQIENSVDGLTSQRAQSPTFDFVNQDKILAVGHFPEKQLPNHLISHEKGFTAKGNVPSQVNKSPIYGRETLNEIEKEEKEIPIQFNSKESAHCYQQNHQTSGNSAHQLDSQGSIHKNRTPENSASYRMDTNRSPLSASLKSTVPLYHLEERTNPQTGDWEKHKNNEINYYNGMPMYPRGFDFQEFQQGIPAWSTESRELIPNNQKTRSCNCSCHAQNIPSRQYPAVDSKNVRPSVIMVPVGWSNNDPGMSHLPLEVDTSSYKLNSQNQGGHWSNRDGLSNSMDYSDDSDSSDDDENGKRDKYFRKEIDGTTARFKLSKEDWARIPINTFPSGGRLLSGDWTRIFLSKVKDSNPWCSLRFKNNHVRSENSRKIHSAVFFRGGAECKRPECNVKVRFVIRKERGKHVEVTYLGNICHSSQPGVSDVTSDKRGMKRDRRTYST
ncbi:uncharacterized protein LOC111326649 [Stylophora pistillata]|uniref:Uncharacterized protein n=1 Tax=Stylophora pistillata TaxID=50429 RepID=A0A2B4SBT7_STYPI|nr:uncharacterized protein LOC111326649 [Stylophora pistillata]XP_022786427.1 uncharacterized protein LOC111326649 [Stylophora pistillata]XP_022786428.1 uncharacterized protein LOC111326649 [Stylophora pistillata]XP_022786429.1 uncharacterized protein LOC111326649 [Stylophora pistillata]XP_022786430.1 uncharacterized protein LOC111326649 [Stylophora pistillata]XP_022786431.1 uncharacterized protein LOC111326649 [Stylophora pistillata]PFX28144.1 hypothetical protein AWC38_SpisGene7140 [Styloph